MSHDADYFPDDAVCPRCFVDLTRENVEREVFDIADAPDGLPAVVLELLCRDCTKLRSGDLA